MVVDDSSVKTGKYGEERSIMDFNYGNVGECWKNYISSKYLLEN
jgi:hypothetical protein